MQVYLASWYASKDQMAKRAAELRAVGIGVTSRWLLETGKGDAQTGGDFSLDYLRETAGVDIEDILQADTLVLNTPSEEELKTVPIPISSWARGGRHFEAGFQYATMLMDTYLPTKIFRRGPRRLVLVGHKENVFHFLDGLTPTVYADGFRLPKVECFSTWEEAFAFLRSEAHVDEAVFSQTLPSSTSKDDILGK